MPAQLGTCDQMTWRKKLAKWREIRRLSQGELSQMVGLQGPRISRWETGEGAPSMEQGFRIARALGLSYDFFADDSADSPPPEPESLVTPNELVMVGMLRGAGIGPADLARLIEDSAKKTGPAAEEHGYSEWGPLRDETEAELRRDRERNRPKPAPRKGSPAEDAKKR